jgi:hypothetical protein
MGTTMKDPLLDALHEMGLDAKDYAVFGSAPLFMHGLKDTLRDLDVIARGRAWQQALELAERGLVEIVTPPSGRGTMLRHPSRPIEIFNEWTTKEIDLDELIDAAELIDGIPFVQVGDVLRWKAESGREKDRRDLEVVRGRTSRPS